MRVVHVVVGMAPLIARAGRVPLEALGVERRVLHPVVLAVHHVVADLHVVEDLRQRQRRDACEPSRRQRAGEQQPAAGDLETALRLDDPSDVGGVALAEVGDDPVSQLVQLAAERLDLLRCRDVDVTLACVRVSRLRSDFKCDVAGGDGHAQLDVLVLLVGDLAGQDVANRAGGLAAGAGVADAHPATEFG